MYFELVKNMHSDRSEVERGIYDFGSGWLYDIFGDNEEYLGWFGVERLTGGVAILHFGLYSHKSLNYLERGFKLAVNLVKDNFDYILAIFPRKKVIVREFLEDNNFRVIDCFYTAENGYTLTMKYFMNECANF